MEASPRVLLRGEFGGGSGVGGGRYALTLTRDALQVRRLGPQAEQERPLVLPLRHVLGCRLSRRRRPGGAPPAEGGGKEGEEVRFAVYCYLPRRGLVGSGRGRRRVVKTFRADGGAGGPEGPARAERWVAAVRCLLLGLEVPAESEISLDLLPRPRRLLLLVNPRSGRSLAMDYCQEHVLPMISEANISYNLVCTEYQDHAKQLVQEVELSEWDGFVIVSGDGLLHEVINGLMARPDWDKAIKMPLGIIPAGSGNALAAAVNHHAGFRMAEGVELLQNCVLLLSRGSQAPMDLVSVSTASGRRLFSFLSLAWGFVADVDIESERYRRLGPARFTLGTLVRLASLRRYRGRLSYLPAGARPKPPLRRSQTTDGGGRPPLGRTLSDTGGWARSPAPVPDSPPPLSSCEGFSFEGLSFQEDEEWGGPGRQGDAAYAGPVSPEGGDASVHQGPGQGDASVRQGPGQGGTSVREGLGLGNPGGDPLVCEGPGRGDPSIHEGPGVSNPGGDPSVCEGPGRGDPSVRESPGLRSPGGDPSVHEGPGLDNPGGDPSVREGPGRGDPSVRENPGRGDPSVRESPGLDNPGGDPSVREGPGRGDPSVRESPGLDSPGGDSSAPRRPVGGGGTWRPPRELPADDLLPPLEEPVPGHWETVEGDFVLVLAIYQSHLGADLMAAPFARFADRALHLCYVTGGVSRAALLRIFLAMERGLHFSLGCPHLVCVPVSAFRLEPLGSRDGVLTVDGERVEYGPVQAQFHPGLARIITGVPAGDNGL